MHHTLTIPLTERIGNRYNHAGDCIITFDRATLRYSETYPSRYSNKLSKAEIMAAIHNHLKNTTMYKSIAVTGSIEELQELIQELESKGYKYNYQTYHEIGSLVVVWPDKCYSTYSMTDPIADVTYTVNDFKQLNLL